MAIFAINMLANLNSLLIYITLAGVRVRYLGKVGRITGIYICFTNDKWYKTITFSTLTSNNQIWTQFCGVYLFQPPVSEMKWIFVSISCQLCHRWSSTKKLTLFSKPEIMRLASLFFFKFVLGGELIFSTI